MSYASYNKILNIYNLDFQVYAEVRKSELDKKAFQQSRSINVFNYNHKL